MEPTHPVLGLVFALSQVVYLGTILTLGVRLALRARRGGEAVEGLLAAHFVLCAGLGYLLLTVGLAASRSPGMLSPQAQAWVLGVGQTISNLGVLAVIAFNQRVFRPRQGWASGLVVLSALALLVGTVGYGLEGGFVHGRFEGPWFWLFYGTILAGDAWVMLEPALYYRAMRRRGSLGLADPLLVNRFALWTIGSACRWLMVAMGAVTAGWAQDAAPVAVVLLVAALLGIGVSVSYWLTFFPTPAYRRFVTGSRLEGSQE